jgi:OPA family sugar phosphate sensor protein UhpC-like MFS transporter
MTEQGADQLMRTWRWRIFAATFVAYAGFYFARKPFSVVKANLGDAFAWDAVELGQLGAYYLIAYTLGQFLSGAAGHVWGPRLALLAGLALSTVANALCGITNSYALFAVLVSLNGLAQATGWSSTVGTMGHWFRRGERGKVMGIWATNYQVGGVLATALAAYMLGKFGFEYAFFAGSAVVLIVWAIVLLNQRNKPSDVGLPDIEEDLPNPDQTTSEKSDWPRDVVINIAIVGVFYFFVKFVRYAIWSWAPFLLQKNYGLAGDDAGYVSIAFDISGIAGVIACGWLSDNVFKGKRAMVSFLFIVGMALSCVLLYTVGATSVTLFAVCMGLIGFSLYGPDALMTGAGAIDVGSAKRATMAAGVINGMGSFGAVLQELVLGSILKEGSVVAVFATLLASATLAAMCLAVLLVRGKIGKATL